jgi:hypothetical protein
MPKLTLRDLFAVVTVAALLTYAATEYLRWSGFFGSPRNTSKSGAAPIDPAGVLVESSDQPSPSK